MPESSAGGNDDMLDRVVWEYARAKIQKMHILNYNGANLAHNHARDIERKLGLPPAVTPFPAPQSISLEQSAPPAPSGIGPGAMIGVALAAGLGPAILGLGLLLGGRQQPVATPSGPADSSYKVTFFDKDGRPIPVPHISEKKP